MWSVGIVGVKVDDYLVDLVEIMSDEVTVIGVVR
jgi:hypothetical protein